MGSETISAVMSALAVILGMIGAMFSVKHTASSIEKTSDGDAKEAKEAAQKVQEGNKDIIATVYKGNIIKNLIMDCQSYTKYRPNETTGGIFVSWRRKEELPTGA